MAEVPFQEDYLSPTLFASAKDTIDPKTIKDTALYERLREYTVGGQKTTVEYFADMFTITRKTPTGIAALDEVVGGGFVRGLSVLGGIPNCGKTTLCVQSTLERAKLGLPSVFLSYDMRGFEIIDKIYSQVSFELYKEKGYTLQDIANKVLLQKTEKNHALLERVINLTQKLTVVDMLKEETQNAYIDPDTNATTSICGVIDTYANLYDTPPVVFIDNLQQLAGFMGEEGKAGLDKTLRMLKRFSTEYNLPIVLISTLGRASYDKPIELSSFKESGNIDYDVDIAFGIEPKYLEEDPSSMSINDFRESPMRDITIKCVKGRDTGYKKAYVTLNAKYCHFEPFDVSKPKTTVSTRAGIQYVYDKI